VEISVGSVRSILQTYHHILPITSLGSKKCTLLNIKCLAKHSVTALEHPPYSTDLPQPSFFLFPGLKPVLEGQRFAGADKVITKATKELINVSKMVSKNAPKS
jgi:hypothetical protein